ncbi:MAG: LuxR C-terminal-related transcriptional regulator, partial [Pseudomonadota bacterium]|nr:LuxR C-terminal-related transcriptional regulator [Pseudomonadota bacterium]
MTTPANESFRTLSDKEKQTLRLIVRGHDAKSIARSLGLSVHTINERLRDARRK